MNNKKVKALLMDKELEGLHIVSRKNTHTKNHMEVCWATASLMRVKRKKIPNTQAEMISQQTGILVKGNEDTPCRNNSK